MPGCAEQVVAAAALKPGGEAQADERQEFCAGKLLRCKVREVYWEGSGRKI